MHVQILPTATIEILDKVPALTILSLFFGVAISLVAVHSRSWPCTTKFGVQAVSWLVVGTLPPFVALGHYALKLDSVPYNVKELFEDRTSLSLAFLWLSLVICGAAPMHFGNLWRVRPSIFAATIIPLAMLVGASVFLLLVIAVPVESIDDLVGTPVLAIGSTLERCLRFQAFFAAPLISWTVAVRLTLGEFGRNFYPGLVAVTLLLMTSYSVVVTHACTVNVTELLVAYGESIGIITIPVWFALMGLVSAVLTRSITSARDGGLTGSLNRLTLVLFAICLSVPLGWQLLVIGTNPRLDKYGQVFSARQFLLSPDREHLLDDYSLLIRFAIVQIVSVGFLTLGMLIASAIECCRFLNKTSQAAQ